MICAFFVFRCNCCRIGEKLQWCTTMEAFLYFVHRLILLVFLLAFPACAAYVAVLETVADQQARVTVSLSDRQYLTNVLREEAVKQLPAVQNFTIMTRENIQQMLPPGKSVEECEGGCLVETGKNIAADYVCQARIGSFDGDLTLSAELYETAGNKLIASFNGQGASMKDLLQLVRTKSPDFFRSVKGSGSFSGVGGIDEIDGPGQFSFGGKKKFVVELVTTPAGALPTIDGKGMPKCLNTPCKVQVEEGNHRFVATLDRYEDADSVVNVTTNNQKIKLALSPNFGWLEVNPKLVGPTATKGNVNVMVDESRMEGSKFELEMGMHSVRLTHPCYDPVVFNVAIAKNKTEIFEKEMKRGKGGLELNAEYNGEPQTVAVYIDGLEAGSTPYVGEVPLCAEVSLSGNGWSEFVNVIPKWHEVVNIVHKLKHNPDESVQVDASTLNKIEVDSNVILNSEMPSVVKLKDDSSTNTLDNKADLSASIPSNVESDNEKKTKWVVLGISAAAVLTGVALAVVGNNQAKDAANKGGISIDEFDKNIDDAKSGQTLRGVGIGLAIAGAVGIGVSFAF